VTGDPELTRRRLVQLGLALPLGLAACGSGDGAAEGLGAGTPARLAATPACHDGDEATHDQTEGPYFKPRSPARRRLVVAGMPGRTRHIHVKVQPRGGRILTTQLYFPREPRNRTDGIYDSALLMRVSRTQERWHGRFGFILEA
jgi:hypothetical protein